MPTAPRDVAQIRLDNALRLFDEFVAATVRHADAATLRGLERRFAERLHIQPSYWSQIKGRSRQIGERLARQFEQCCNKPAFWMDQDHGPSGTAAASAAPGPTARGAFAAPASEEPSFSAPQDDDERFIVGLVLTYYRRHPQRARTRLLDLLGEVLTPAEASTGARPAPPTAPVAAPAPQPSRPARSPVADDPWQQVATGIAPLKPKHKK